MRSVVMASYMGGRFIGAQLDSILAQIGPGDEVIISDDASSDDTVAVAMQRNDPRVKIVRNDDTVGYVRNFERTIARARGQYIIFSDQDDVWLPGKLAQLSVALNAKSCAVSDAVVVDEDLNELHASFFALRSASNFEFLPIFMKPCFIGATMACRKSYLDALMPFPPHVPHDFWITLNATWDRELEIIMDPLILYRRHSSAASVSATGLKRPFLTILTERATLAAAMISRRMRRKTSSGRKQNS
ncbi:MAG: glycosyltransferase [Pseudomonadota bacterium]|nr:glycosyltransferase [Pseudomonadota bacterium]